MHPCDGHVIEEGMNQETVPIIPIVKLQSGIQNKHKTYRINDALLYAIPIVNPFSIGFL